MKISVITATWNSAETVQDTIDSVIRQIAICKQHGVEIEHIIKDGGSKDETVDIIKRNEPRYEGRLRWVSEPDKGIYDAMNKGISMASGEVVGILNSDDFYSSDDVLVTVANTFAQHPDIDALYGDVKYVEWDDTTRMLRYYSSRMFRRSWMRMGFMPAHPSFYCKKSTYEKFKLDGTKIDGFKGDPSCGYFNTTYKIASDFENLLRMIFVGKIKTQYIQKVFVTMRTGGASSSGVASHKQINKDHMRAFKENGVYSNYLFISLRYLYKIGEVLLGKLGV